MGSALPGPAWVNATHSSSALQEAGKLGKAEKCHGRGLQHWCAPCSPISLCCEEHQAVPVLERSLDITRLPLHPRIFWVYGFLVSAVKRAF